MARVRVPSGKLKAEALYEYALRALACRSHTLAEMEAKIRRRCADQDDVEVVIQRLRSHGYVNDIRVAEAHSAMRRDSGLLGRRRVLGELKRRGVDEATAEAAITEAYEDRDESALARAFLRRKVGSLRDGSRIQDPKHLARLFRALARAGFDYPAISDALRDVSDDTEFLEALSESGPVSEIEG